MAFVPTRRVRIGVQTAMFALWVTLILATRYPMDSWILKHVPASFFLRIDPLVMTAVTGGTRIAVTLVMLGFVTLAVSILLGRVFCGWICPLGTIFDFYGWFVRRMKIRFFGPSPSWFRLKYYLLIAILLFTVFGVVSPLMGFDPIVLLTRTIAALVNPLFRANADLTFHAGGALGNRGALVDIGTLILFIGIMASTTKVSRIWCRTTCPLGAYLAVTSRHSVLRRETVGCVHCNICSAHCPTGAIDFQNAEIYNESECIKCFACSQECPVDANFFTFKNPIPAVTATYAPVSLERRKVIVTTAMVVAGAPILQLSSGEPRSSKSLIRPPMSREEHDFLSSCIRCGECMKACPTGILKPAGLFEHGLRALWTPVMVATEGACQKGCNACAQACPTDAIMKYPIEEKYAYKAGTAIFNASLCISNTENKFCSECVRVCPTDAIELIKGWEPKKVAGQANLAGASEEPAPLGQHPTRPAHISFDKCVGCGACENACNQIVFGEPAMITTSFGRAVPTKLKKEPV